jgi:hypothetical protein
MLACTGCGGRNPPEIRVCPFCHRRLGGKANGFAARRVRRLASILLASLLLVAVLAGLALFVLARGLQG